MTKRYGRNQKRKHREEINLAKRTITELEKRCSALIERGKRNQGIVEETANVLGSHFITLDPGEEVVTKLDTLMPSWRVDYRRHLCYADVPGSPMARPEMFTEVSLSILKFLPIAEDFNMKMHLRFQYDGEQVGYAIRREVIEQLPSDYLANKLGHEMARMMVEGIKQKRGG